MNCPSCGADLPEDARFCIECGVTLERASVGPTVQLRKKEDVPTVACAACGARSPAEAIFCVRCGRRLGDPAPRPVPAPPPPPAAPALPARGRRRARARQGDWGAASTAIFLIGLGLLLLTKSIWPGILIVIGLASFVRTAGKGYVLEGVRNTFWLFGLAFLFMVPRLFWPGVLVLFGLSVLIEMVMRGRRCP